MSNGVSDLIGEKKKGVKTNNGLEFGKKKDGFVRNSVLDLIGEREKDGVKTNNGLEFGKKKDGFDKKKK